MLTRQSTDPPTPSSSSRPKLVSPISSTNTSGSTDQPHPWHPLAAAAATARPTPVGASLMQPPPVPPPPDAALAQPAASTLDPSSSTPQSSVAGPSQSSVTASSSQHAAVRPSADQEDAVAAPTSTRRASPPRGAVGRSRSPALLVPPRRQQGDQGDDYPFSIVPLETRTGAENRQSRSSVAAAPPPPARHDRRVIDLTSSSPPPGRRELVPAARASRLLLPGSSLDSAAEASTSSARQQQTRRRRQQAGPSTSTATPRALFLSSDDDDDDTADSDYAPLAGPSQPRATASSGVVSGVRTRRRTAAVAELSSDSDIEVVSERPASQPPVAEPSRLSRYGLPVGSPPPYIVPPGATATSSNGSTMGRSQPRRSTRARTSPGAPSGARATAPSRAAAGSAAEEDADATFARALADAEAAELGYDDYETAQRSAAAGAARRGGGGGGRGFGGVFGRGNGAETFHHYMSSMISDLGGRSYLNHLLGGAYWSGGPAVHGGAGSMSGIYGHAYGGGPYGGGPAGAAGGWGGAAKVKAASKKYGVRMSHPGPVERGFSRDIVEPRDPDGAPPPPPPPVAASSTKKSRSRTTAAGKPTEELEPVCASCLETLLLSGTGNKKVFALRCGHAVCAKCLEEAKERCRAIRAQEKGGWVLDDSTGVPSSAAASASRINGTSASNASKGKGKGKRSVAWDLEAGAQSNSSEFYLSSSHDDDDDDGDDGHTNHGGSARQPPAAKRRRADDGGTTSIRANGFGSAKSKGAKGKGKSRADETGVEENWTTCPVSTCDGRGSDLLAEEGWAKPFEFFT